MSLHVQDVVEKTEAELAATSEKRKENGRRLQEMQQKQRADKVSPVLISSFIFRLIK